MLSAFLVFSYPRWWWGLNVNYRHFFQTSCPDKLSDKLSRQAVQTNCPEKLSRQAFQTSCPDKLSRQAVQISCPDKRSRQADRGDFVSMILQYKWDINCLFEIKFNFQFTFIPDDTKPFGQETSPSFSWFLYDDSPCMPL